MIRGFLLVLVLALPAAAQTFTVTNTSSSGSGSLSAAITAANAYSGAATIHFNSGLGTITLTGELPILTNPAGITINGNGNYIVGGSTSNTTGYRVFFLGVSTGESAATTGYGSLLATTTTHWSINNLTILDGNARGGSGNGGGAGLGGGIFVNAGNLSLSGVTFNGNRAIGGNGSGSSFAGGGGMGGNGGDSGLARISHHAY